MRDVNSGWLIRYTHANVASFFFIFVYALNNKFIFSNNLFFYNSNFDTLAREIFKPLNKTKLDLSVLGLLQQDHPQPKKNKEEPNKNKDKEVNSTLQVLDDPFYPWFVGFTDAEGSFSIETKGESTVNFRFRITLHIEDSAVLFLIKDKLGIGIVNIQGNTCTYYVHSFQFIINVLIPIFDKYPLLTLKQLDYRD